MEGRVIDNTERGSTAAATIARSATGPTADLLARVTEAALDEDYAMVGAQRRDPAARSRPRTGVAAMVALLAFGLLIAVAALEVRSGAPQAAREREALLTQIAESKADFAVLSAQLEVLRQQVIDLQGTAAATSQRDAELLEDLQPLRTLTGAAAVSGSGVRVLVDDAPNAKPRSQGVVLDVDLQVLINGLWQAGAEAIAVNGHRLGPLSAIRSAGSAITVNYRSLSPPYVVVAVGDPATLEARFIETTAGQTWLDLETNFGLRFDINGVDTLTLPPAPAARLEVRYAQRQGELP